MPITDPASRRPRTAALIRILGWGGVLALLALPAVAMRFTDEVRWTPSDFVFAAVVLGGAGILVELVIWKSGDVFYRLGAVLALATSVLLVWVTGAVGLIGDEGEAANLLYLGVIGAALVGAVMARFEAVGMARALAATGLLQAVIGGVAWSQGWGAGAPAWPADVLGASGAFTLLWWTSAAFFSQAAARTLSITRR
jgi:hypothetical protein